MRKSRMLIGRAVRLYVEQSAYGSKVALLSLREVAGLLAADGHALARAVPDPLVRQLLVAYVVARDGQSIYDDGVAGPKDPAVMAVIDAVLAQPNPAAGDDLDRLAALAYQAARYRRGREADGDDGAPARPLGACQAGASAQRSRGGGARLDRGAQRNGQGPVTPPSWMTPPTSAFGARRP